MNEAWAFWPPCSVMVPPAPKMRANSPPGAAMVTTAWPLPAAAALALAGERLAAVLRVVVRLAVVFLAAVFFAVERLAVVFLPAVVRLRAAARAARAAAEVFLQRRLAYRASTGELIRAEFTKLHYPLYWHYDILGGLKGMMELGLLGDPRCAAALDLPVSLGSDDTLTVWLNGQKLLAQNVHRAAAPDAIRTHLGACDFCRAEAQLLARFPPRVAAPTPAAVYDMPPALRRLAEELMHEPSLERARFVESIYEIERLSFTDA